jgi:hypothetical protein
MGRKIANSRLGGVPAAEKDTQSIRADARQVIVGDALTLA